MLQVKFYDIIVKNNFSPEYNLQ